MPARSSADTRASGRLERPTASGTVMMLLLDELRERLLHRLHSAARAGLHVGVDLLDLALADQVPNRVVEEQDLECGDTARAVGGREQRLGDDPLEGVGELHPNLRLLLGREDVDDAVDRARRALGVQRAEDEVTGLGRGERGRDRLEVAHLAEEDHVGVLTQGAAERVGEPGRVLADLALVDDAALVVVEELDRILDRDDVVGAGAVDLVDDRRERRGLTRAGRAGDEHEAARLGGQLVQARRQARAPRATGCRSGSSGTRRRGSRAGSRR